MGGWSARTSGTVVTVAGLALSALHLRTAVLLWSTPALVVVEAFVPLLLSLSITGVGTLVRRGELVPEQFADRVMAWGGVGSLSLGAAIGWLFLDAAVRGQSMLATGGTLLNATTLGVLGGVVIGVYDARGRHQRHRAAQLTRINDTLRIATQEIMNATDRAELETAVCERLTASNIYDSAWLGRYAPGTTRIRPVAWAGHDDEYIDSLEVTVDPTEPLGRGPGGEAIRTREIQPVQDVFAEPSLEPWWDLLESRGVASMAVVPLVGASRVYGLLSVYANRSNVFDASEREALTELGESVGHALDSMAARDKLARREEELAHQNEHLDEFASVVSHDLRNPLNVAQGNLELARETGAAEYLKRVGEALDRMNELIDDVLTLARNGRTVSEFTPVDLESVVEGAWNTTTTGAATLVVEDSLGVVQGDEQRLVQVFENLFRNSVEHGSAGSRPQAGDGVEHGSTGNRTKSGDSVERGPSDPGSGAPEGTAAAGRDADVESFTRGATSGEGGDAQLTVTVGRTDDGFYVADDGPGIPESERDRVFETGYSTDPDGTGFGLNIVRSIAEAHGWEVVVTESADGGARFEFGGIAAAEDGRVERPQDEDGE
ncbi:GAF domain-containing protein [Haloplanus litoreus]|uniref:histidine kinase n=1 Tax=Haloplanus litoreus TaxID=767515 RepID=A0ABD5ZV49_9EURY